MTGESARQIAETDLQRTRRAAFWSATAVVATMVVVFAEFWFIEKVVFWPAPVAAVAAVAWSATVIRIRTNALKQL